MQINLELIMKHYVLPTWVNKSMLLSLNIFNCLKQVSLSRWMNFQLVRMLWNTLDLTFYFSFIYFLLILFSFFFSFSSSFRTMKEARDKEVTWQVTWCDRPRLGWKDLEDDVRAHGECMVALSKKWGEHEVEAWTIGQV